MNDRYLYRAKRKNWRELPKEIWWVEGYYAYFKQNDNHCIYYEVDGFTLVCDIDVSTLCACTGLVDKNGKLIWENDIVKEFNSSGDEWNLSQIVFGEYSLNLGWCTKGIKTLHEYNRRLFNVGFGTSEAGKCEVIGNIFDNLELLE